METQTPLKHISSAPKPPNRHAQRKKSSITTKRSGSKVPFSRKSRRKRNTYYKSFKKTSQRYCASLLKSTLSYNAEIHSNNLVRLASPVLSSSTPQPVSPVPPSSYPLPSLPSPLSSSPGKDCALEKFLHESTHDENPIAAVATVHAQSQRKPTRLINIEHDSHTHNPRNRNSTLYLSQQKRPSNAAVLESLRNLIQPLRIRIPEEHIPTSNTNQTKDIQSPLHEINQQMTDFAHILAAKESELQKLWQDWDENTREIEEFVKEVQDGGIDDSSGNDSADVDGETEIDTHAPDDKEKQEPQFSTFKALAARIENISKDAIDAMQAEVQDQQARRRVVREKMLAVLKEGMIGSQ